MSLWENYGLAFFVAMIEFLRAGSMQEAYLFRTFSSLAYAPMPVTKYWIFGAAMPKANPPIRAANRTFRTSPPAATSCEQPAEGDGVN